MAAPPFQLQQRITRITWRGKNYLKASPRNKQFRDSAGFSTPKKDAGAYGTEAALMKVRFVDG